MSKFRTVLPKFSFPFQFSHSDPTFCIGSCFAETIGHRLAAHKFSTLINPFGILYNPFSIGNALTFLLEERRYYEKDLFEYNELWHSFDHHGHFSQPDLLQTLQNINEKIASGNSFLKKARRMMITFGTSHVFIEKKTRKIVANCHKLPSLEFEPSTLTITAMLNKLIPIFQELKSGQPSLEILLTVSPVRHIRDGLVENQRSKARLHLLCEKLCDTFDFVHYFPSYEIIMDDLRDYRFFNSDLIHPNEQAIDYIWEYFGNSFFSNHTKDLNSKIIKIINGLNHRPFHPASNAHQSFRKKILEWIIQIEEENSLDFTQEKLVLES